MHVNGFQLQQAIREAKAERDQWAGQFDGSLQAFPGEEKSHPMKITGEFMLAERRLAKLQVAQTRFNLEVRVTAFGVEMTLLEAIKRVGGAGRHEKMWRSAASPTAKRGRYYDPEPTTRDKDVIVAKPSVTFEEAAVERRGAAKEAAELRAAIQFGNSRTVDIEIEDGLLETW
jgi:hypothetical protein